MTGSKIILESLIKEGVDTIFGYPGGAVLNIYDELFNYKDKIKHVLVRHEQGAAHAADGYARASGKVGVVLVTSGPGATNTITGIATAYMDSVPIVILTGQVPTNLIGNDAFQEADTVGITRPCTKHNYLVKDIKDLARTIKEAFYIASTGRPGPVLIDIPKDITSSVYEFDYPEAVELRGYNPTYFGHHVQLSKVVKELLNAKRPLLYIGGGVIISNASAELKELAELLDLPVTSTLMGLGGFPSEHSLFFGMLGMHGTYAANMAISNADFIIAIGARFDDRVTGKVEEFGRNAKFAHIDIDPSSIGKNVKIEIPVVGDVKSVLNSLLEMLSAKSKEISSTQYDRLKWLEEINIWKYEHPLSYKMNDVIKPQYVIEKIYELTGGSAIISTEVGQNQMWTAQFYKFNSPRTFLTSGGLGTMGYGFPAAIGAQIACPDKVVFDIAGDGSIQMNIQELATAVQYNLPVKIAIVNNNFLGMIRQWQELFYKKRYSFSEMNVNPDFVKLAEAYGAVGLRATRPDEVEGVLKKALSIKKPVIMDFVVAPEESVYPMVAPGAPITGMLLV
ncbi:MAG: biosynthetic-type acetolactate synthase large subunit [Deltaproteobacteria bacterium]|nr:biosynthetic-type acetolactate synthase large subunit [Deltaproteobacteria bacterium]MCL5879393.1 biosynthetic-type acetolactate synthase large subunit [Deltaproteobacteria bacterium]MDA8304408.1 biosynthetic-type acetolactate synthase large subunit [Deltaproteobacteria bacterium]